MTTLTRSQLYELVWSTPLTKLAPTLGLSDVGLAKACARLDIPRPGRGYWAQLAAGAKPEREPLPTSRSDAEPISFDDARISGTPPTVTVAKTLVAPHRATTWIADAFKKASTDRHGRLVVKPHGYELMSVREENVPRLLRVLDALFKAMTERGHVIDVCARGENSDEEVVVTIRGQELWLQVEEKLGRKPHELTRDERKRAERGWGYGVPKYDHFPSGELIVRMRGAHYSYRGLQSVADSKRNNIEDQVGRLVLVGEEIATFNANADATEARRDARRAEKARRRIRGQRLAWYQQWLARDLSTTASRWHEATRAREFLAAYERALGHVSADGNTEWLRAAHTYVDALDPLSDVASVAKTMSPSDALLDELVNDALASETEEVDETDEHAPSIGQVLMFDGASTIVPPELEPLWSVDDDELATDSE